jgi:hypothetical protein
MPFRARGGETINLVVRVCDGVSDALGSSSRLALQSPSEHGERYVGRFSAGCLPANAIDDNEKTAGGVAMETIFVNVAQAAGMRLTSSYECVDSAHVEY